MATRMTAPAARVDRQLAEVVAAQRVAGEEPSVEAVEAVRAVLTGQATAAQAIREGFAALEARHGLTR
ncbi:MAG: hypothetical protein ACSLE3_04855 [Microbacteriaceae bacterium]